MYISTLSIVEILPFLSNCQFTLCLEYKFLYWVNLNSMYFIFLEYWRKTNSVWYLGWTIKMLSNYHTSWWYKTIVCHDDRKLLRCKLYNLKCPLETISLRNSIYSCLHPYNLIITCHFNGWKSPIFNSRSCENQQPKNVDPNDCWQCDGGRTYLKIIY